jgi:hypothetical protein
MSEDRALEVLGLTATPSEQELKRAYLRQVKAHPPERDANGFREVREAYELLKRGAWTQRLIAASRPTPSRDAEAEAPLAVEAPTERPTEAAEEQPTEAAEELPTEAEAEEPGPSFPIHIGREIEALNQALAGDDPASAATAMIALYGMPLLEQAPVPPPIFALKTFMVLMERGRAKLARELLDAFESYVQTHQDGSATSSDVAARWKLAREVSATHELDQRLARAVAAGLRSGQLYTAGDAAESAFHEHGAKLERYMRVKAPTVWGSIAPLIRPAQHVATGSISGFKVGGWPISIVAVVLFNIIRLAIPSSGYSSSTPTYTEPPKIESYQTPALSFSSGALNVNAQAEQALERQLNGSWASLERAVGIGDCQTVREQWPLYQAAEGVASHTDRKLEASRKQKVLEMCPELKEVVEPTP